MGINRAAAKRNDQIRQELRRQPPIDTVSIEQDNRSEHPLHGLLRAVFASFLKARQKVVVFFNAYFDDSGTDPSSKVVAVGGCINYADTWENFNREWQQRLDSWGLSKFHMTDCESLLGEYRRWDRPLQKRRLRELLDIIYRYRVDTFGHAVSRMDFERAIAKVPEAMSQCDGPYGFLGQLCVRGVRKRWADLFTSWQNSGDLAYVSYFFEDGTPGYGKIVEAWYRGRERIRWEDTQIARVSKDYSPPIQVADIVAYELAKMYPMAAAWVPGGRMRYPAQQLSRGPHDWRRVSRSGLMDELLRMANGR